MKKICIFFLLVFALPAYASLTKQISVQGVLADNTGKPATGPHVLKLNLYDALTGGNLLYSDIESVTVANGVFDVFLGNQIPMPDSLAFDRPYYLGISVDNGAELAPRSLLSPAPNAFYAIRSGASDSARIAGSAPPTGAAGGDLFGTYPSPVVSAIQSFPVATTAPTVGQSLIWNGSQWTPSSGGSAVAFSVQAGNFQTLPHDVYTTLAFSNTTNSGAFDDGSYFSVDSNWFKAPLDGSYYLDAFLSLDTRSTPPSGLYIVFVVNGSIVAYRRIYTLTSGTYTQIDYTQPLKLHAGDHVRVQCEPLTNGTSTMGGNASGVVQFSGFKIN